MHAHSNMPDRGASPLPGQMGSLTVLIYKLISWVVASATWGLVKTSLTLRDIKAPCRVLHAHDCRRVSLASYAANITRAVALLRVIRGEHRSRSGLGRATHAPATTENAYLDSRRSQRGPWRFTFAARVSVLGNGLWRRQTQKRPQNSQPPFSDFSNSRAAVSLLKRPGGPLPMLTLTL